MSEPYIYTSLRYCPTLSGSWAGYLFVVFFGGNELKSITMKNYNNNDGKTLVHIWGLLLHTMKNEMRYYFQPGGSLMRCSCSTEVLCDQCLQSTSLDTIYLLIVRCGFWLLYIRRYNPRFPLAQNKTHICRKPRSATTEPKERCSHNPSRVLWAPKTTPEHYHEHSSVIPQECGLRSPLLSYRVHLRNTE